MKSVLAECAWAASRTKSTYLAVRYWKLAARRGKKKALIATAHKMLTIAYFILLRKEPYFELGPDYLDGRSKDKKARQLLRQLRKLGLDVVATNIAD